MTVTLLPTLPQPTHPKEQAKVDRLGWTAGQR